MLLLILQTAVTETTKQPQWYEILSALLTPLIAIITTYIAVQQYRTGRAKFRHELYDRRMAVYKAASKYLTLVAVNYDDGTGEGEKANEEKKAFREFDIANAESAFLFDDKVVRYLNDIYFTGFLRPTGRYLIKHGDDENVEEQKQKLAESTSRHLVQLQGLRDVFMKYLDLKNLK